MYLLSYFASLIPSGAFASFVCFILLCAVACFIIYSFTKNTAFSLGIFVVAAAVLILIYVCKSTYLEGAFPDLLDKLCVYDRYTNFISGMFDVSAVVYYISVAMVCLFLTVQALDRRRWN
jgi:ABC-2 type transport system permease protein